jgi:hypothetical protein
MLLYHASTPCPLNLPSFQPQTAAENDAQVRSSDWFTIDTLPESVTEMYKLLSMQPLVRSALTVLDLLVLPTLKEALSTLARDGWETIMLHGAEQSI